MNIILIGPPGAGKGTQAHHLIDEFDLLHISTGDLLRSAIQAGSPLGMAAEQAVSSGVFVPDDVVIGLVEASLDQRRKGQGFVLDGFPRTRAQAYALEALLERLGEPVDHVFLFGISPDLLLDRIATRASQSALSGDAVRPDDNAGILQKRIKEFESTTLDLLPFYEKRKLVRRLDASTPVEMVTSQIREMLFLA